MQKRKFSIVNFPDQGEFYGKYIGIYPNQAARKAFNKLSNIINLSNKDKNKFLVFSIIDLDSKKIYTYKGTKIKLNRPLSFKTKDNNIIKINYKSIVSKI